MSGYEQYNAKELLAALAKESSVDGAQHLATWELNITVLETRQRQLREAREELAAHWPPEGSEAAAAFRAQIDLLAGNMDRAVATASLNHALLKIVIETLGNAQTQVRSLVADYDSVPAAQAYARSVNQRVDDKTAQALYRKHLDERARVVMTNTDEGVSSASDHFSLLPDPSAPYGARTPLDPTQPQPPHRTGGPVARVTGLTAPGGSSPSSGQQTLTSTSASVSAGAGPSLAGVIVSPGSSASGAGSFNGSSFVPRSSAGVASIGDRGTGVIGGFGAPPLPQLGRSGSAPTGVERLGRGPGGALGESTTGEAFGRVGGVPGTIGPGVGPIGRSSSSTPNPVRRSIAGSQSASSEGRSRSTPFGGGWRDRQFEQYAERRRQRKPGADPDDRWSAEEGGPALLQPRLDEPRHDPPPGVFGIDR